MAENRTQFPSLPCWNCLESGQTGKEMADSAVRISHFPDITSLFSLQIMQIPWHFLPRWLLGEVQHPDRAFDGNFLLQIFCQKTFSRKLPNYKESWNKVKEPNGGFRLVFLKQLHHPPSFNIEWKTALETNDNVQCDLCGRWGCKLSIPAFLLSHDCLCSVLCLALYGC